MAEGDQRCPTFYLLTCDEVTLEVDANFAKSLYVHRGSFFIEETSPSLASPIFKFARLSLEATRNLLVKSC